MTNSSLIDLMFEDFYDSCPAGKTLIEACLKPRHDESWSRTTVLQLLDSQKSTQEWPDDVSVQSSLEMDFSIASALCDPTNAECLANVAARVESESGSFEASGWHLLAHTMFLYSAFEIRPNDALEGYWLDESDLTLVFLFEACTESGFYLSAATAFSLILDEAWREFAIEQYCTSRER